MIEKLYKTIYHMIYTREYELQERIFRVIILIGCSLASIGIIECIILMDINTITIPLFILLFVMIICLLATFKYRKINLVAMIVGFFIILFIFPSMFFLSGGLDGGAVIWFVLGLFYIFLMFSGKKLLFFLILSLLVDILTYGIGYYYPEMIIPMNSKAIAYLDSLFAVIIVGLAGGIILKVQMKIFYIERSISQAQQERLENISNSKNNFFASMSHEIRTPINTIIGLNEMILRESKEKETREYARNIQSASKMLLSLVNDILDLSQMEIKRMEIIPMEYKTVDLFHELIDMIQIRLKEKNLEFFVDIDESMPSVLFGDVKRINQVILNILTNAAKYTENGSVTFTAHTEELSQKEEILLKVSVQDTGIGIRKEDLDHIYDFFHRIDAKKNRKIEGSGLGLSITKQLVDMMNGKITIDSIYTKGSTFTIVLPQKVIDKTPIGSVQFVSFDNGEFSEYQQSFEAPEARILIVDDNHMNSIVESKLLAATKVQIDIAKSGEECLSMTKRKYYHVILMDYMMPEMDGLQTLKQLRKQENGLCRDCAVIVLSANSATEALQTYLQDGFDGYLEKPIQGKELEAEILKFLPEDIIEYRLEQEKLEQKTFIQQISHKRKKIYITTDCVSDLPDSLIEKYDIGLMYLYIKTESGRFADTLEISSDNLTQYITETSSAAVTDVVSVVEYENFFADALSQAEQVIHISMASYVGGSYKIAVTAAQGFDHVHVIDSSQISCGQGLVVLYAARLALEGLSADIICKQVEKMKKRVETRFLMPSIHIFYQHGFTNKTNAKICELFQFHPVLKMGQSKLNLVGVRGGKMDGAWKRFIHWHLLWKKRINTDIIFISHVGCTIEQQTLIQREILKHIPFKKIIIQRASVTTACNSGIGTFGFAYYVNIKEEALY